MKPKLTTILALLTPVTAFHPYVLQTYRFLHSPFAAGQRYIHSPEHFLPTQGLASGPNFELQRTLPPVQLRDEYWLTELRYRTAWGPGSARVFTHSANVSYFMLTTAGRPCIMGQMRVRALDRGGFALRCFAQRAQPSGLWEMLLGGAREPTATLVESMVHASWCAVAEDENLKAYRRHVLPDEIADTQS